VSVRPKNGQRVVELALVNAQAEPTGHKDTAWLFQAELTVTALDGAKAVFLPIDDPEDGLQGVVDDSEELHLRLLYRHERRYAAGRNVAVHAEVEEGEMPSYNVPATVAPVGEGTDFEHVLLSMDELATAGPEELKQGLRPLVEGYRRWLDMRQAEIPGLPEALRPVAVKAVHDGRTAASRIAAGARLLTDPAAPGHEQALQAFHFANETMAAQRRHTAIGALREEGLTYTEALAKVMEQGAKAASSRVALKYPTSVMYGSAGSPYRSKRVWPASSRISASRISADFMRTPCAQTPR
jgi:hypothetical protein